MSKRLSASIFSLLVLIVPRWSSGTESDLERAAQALMLGKSLVLRTPYSSASLKFDPQGRLLTSSEIGSTGLDGILQVESVSLKSDGLELKGRRLVLALRLSPDAIVTTIPTARKFKLSLKFNAPPANESEIMHALSPIFMGGDAQQVLLKYWTPLTDFSDKCSDKDKQGDGMVGLLEGSRPVYWCKIPQLITAPKPLHSPEPNFSAAAMKEAERGTTRLRMILNEKGLPELLAVLSDPQSGAVAEAVQAVSRWRFAPATKNGQPVAVVIDVEIEAHSF
ncbi:MAG TPA: energy transducer TonB [Terriglobales bacterium]|jgi:hypothetical protein